jgi:hypothetical protein
MGYPHALVQVVQPDSPGLTLHTWNHVVWEMNPARFINSLQALPGARMVRIDDPDAHPDLEGDCGLAFVESANGPRYAVCAQAADLEMHVHLLNSLVDSYKDRARFDRTSLRRPPSERDLPVFLRPGDLPGFHIQDLLRLAGQAYLLPGRGHPLSDLTAPCT